MKTTILLLILFFVNCSAQPQPFAPDDAEGVATTLTRPLPVCTCPELITMADTIISGNNVYYTKEPGKNYRKLTKAAT
jgi:PBP1b-binding outer membrane lipoprotein LpoB